LLQVKVPVVLGFVITSLSYILQNLFK